MDRLTNTVRPYAWGSTTAIPVLLSTEPTGEPQAELWMGAHPAAPSHIDRGAGLVSLADVISANPRAELGEATVDLFGSRLPFLLKVLAPQSPLSLQVHPNRQQAHEGYLAEEERGVPLGAPFRNYRDTNHKPELICALEPFHGLCGFRAPEQAADLLERLGADSLKYYVDILRTQPGPAAMREVLTAVLTAAPERIAETVDEAASTAERLSATSDPYASSYAAYAAIARFHPGDRGVIAAMLLNHVKLQPGEALYLAAGVPHAYLSGLGVEIMASSDNVLRCGLTPKHVDVPELLRVVDFRSAKPEVVRPRLYGGPLGEEVYHAPVEEFRLSRLLVAEGALREVPGHTPQIVFCVSGRARLRRDNSELDLLRGQSAFLPAGSDLALAGGCEVFRATVSL